MAGAFVLAGLSLACLGIFGVVSCGVAQSANAIGISVALGATFQSEILLVLPA